MSVVSLLGVNVKNNPSPFTAPYEFEITFECLEPLRNDLEFRLTYVGSAQSSEHDQVLDTLLVGPVPVGVNKFVFEADPPDLTKIPNTEVVGVTVVILSCAYDDREFVRVGYYVNNEYTDEALATDPPAKPLIEKIQRSILAEKPRVTRFAIKWDSEETAPAEFPPEQPDVDAAEDDEAAYGAEEHEEEVEEEGDEDEAGPAQGEDSTMGGTDDKAHNKPDKDEDEASDAGSEDLEAESEGSEDEDEDEEEDNEADEDMDTTEDAGQSKRAHAASTGQSHQGADVMVH